MGSHGLTGLGDHYFGSCLILPDLLSQIRTENLKPIATSRAHIFHQGLRDAQALSKLPVEGMRVAGRSSTLALPLVTVAQVSETG